MSSGGLSCDDFNAIFRSAAPLLDVRAPVEFAKGAFPTAVNIPLLDDNARHLVGIEYKNAGQQSAIDLGSQLLPAAQRQTLVQRWLSFTAQNPQGYLYCFRGGLRSRITQQWLQDAGCEYRMVEGGYKAMRQFLIQSLQVHCATLPLCLIGGRTGTGKTRLLHRLPNAIDLEALARHRGSSFGRMVVAQPSNIDFENAVAIEFIGCAANPQNTVFLEDEARMIGSTCIPEPLRNQTQQSPVAILEAPLEERVNYAVEDYVVDLLQRYQQHFGDEDGFTAFADYHRDSLGRVQKRFGGVRYQQALALLEKALKQHRTTDETHFYRDFIQTILTDYYDPMYDYQVKRKQDRVVFTGDADELLSWCATHSTSIQSISA